MPRLIDPTDGVVVNVSNETAATLRSRGYQDAEPAKAPTKKAPAKPESK